MVHPARRPIVAALLGLLSLPVVALGGQGALPQIAGGRQAAAAVPIHADFHTRTSLRVSSSELRFDVSDTGGTVRATLDFVAAARTYTGGDVVLTFEPDGTVQAPPGVDGSRVQVVLANAGSALGTDPQVAGKWSGSGVRQGRLEFSLRGAPASGVYRVNVKFVLSAP